MRKTGVILLTALALFSFIACNERIINGNGNHVIDRSTPAGTVELIEDSLTERDIDELGKCLTADFAFHFDEDDIGKQVGEYTIPESWTLDDFLNPVSRMFDNAHSIDISINSSNIGDPDPDDTSYTADNVQIQFLVMVDSVNGYLAKGFVTFGFRAVYKEKNEKEWLVAAWRDFTSPTGSGGRNVEEASFGEILVRFYKS